MKNSRENTPKMFNLTGKETAARPVADEASDIFADLQVPESPDAEETSDTETTTGEKQLTLEEAQNLRLAHPPDEQTIVKTATEYAENQPPKNETAGFKAAGERIRIVVPDDPTDPERTARLTQLGLRAIKTIEANRERADKADKKDK
jgi:hypothetical protein